MKRIKLLPSVLMLVLCIGVLAMGIYAATPATNTITGQITVNSANAQIEVSAYVGGGDYWYYEKVLDGQTTRTGYTWNISNGVLDFDMSKFNSLDESIPKFIQIHLVNKSTKSLGAYFYKPGEELDDGFATLDSILLQTTANNIEEGKEEEVVANIKLSSYTHIAGNDNAEGGYDEVDMFIKITPTVFESSKTGKLTLSLNIEDYKTEYKTEAEANAATGFVKYPEGTFPTSANGTILAFEDPAIDVSNGSYSNFEPYFGENCVGLSNIEDYLYSDNYYISLPSDMQCIIWSPNGALVCSITIDIVFTDGFNIDEDKKISNNYTIVSLNPNVTSLSCGCNGENYVPYSGTFPVPAQITTITFSVSGHYNPRLVKGLKIPKDSTLACELPSGFEDTVGHSYEISWFVLETGESVTSITDRDFDATYYWKSV